MGIQGLMSYINMNPRFFDSYQLHKNFLVIDGSSLACQIYNTIKYTCAWGGDYDKYARAVAEFFDDLARCEVTPIVVGDGGLEIKKLKTVIKRAKDTLKTCHNYNPQSPVLMIPLALIDVFYATLKRKGVKIYQSLFEADSSIAGLAKILNCPVLSYDSDFFIFNVMFIPLNTLEPYIAKIAEGGGYMKRCQIFRPENFLKIFPGLDSNLLPLAAILLGNDYVDADVFKNFFHYLKLSAKTKNVQCDRHRKIHATFSWLSDYCLNDAVEAVLSKLPKPQHRRFIHIIERVVNDYLVLPYNILNNLNLEDKYDKEKQRLNVKPFVFQQHTDISDSKYIRSDKNDIRTRTHNTEEIVNNLPSWFLREYTMGALPRYFINMMTLRICILHNQVENLDYQSVHTLSVEILKVIDGLLVAHSKEPVANLELHIRTGRKMSIQNFEEPVKGTTTILFPALERLRSTDTELKKQIINDTLEVTELEDIFADIPPQWKLYFMTLQFWARNTKEPKINLSHIFAILTAMLFSVIDEKIGHYRNLEKFIKVHEKIVSEIKARRKCSQVENASELSDSLEEALKAVTTEDCILAAPFFISQFKRNELHVTFQDKYDISAVHVFMQFQSICKYVLDLNMLLGQPYEKFSFSELYNGTLFYNFYKNFEKRESASKYVAQLLQPCPSLLKVIRLLFLKIVQINVFFNVTPVEAQIKSRRKRRRKKIKTENDEISDKEVENCEESSDFYDPQNLFSILNATEDSLISF